MQQKLAWIAISLMMPLFVFVYLFDTVQATGASIFVNGDNTTGPWDGSSDHPFQFIQDAINVVPENGTVYVFKGIYLENIVINKPIKVNGSGEGYVIIDGRGIKYVVNITANHVTLQGCTIKNGTCGIRIDKSSGNIILKNTIRDADYGIFLGITINNFIYNNNFLNNKQNAYDKGSNSWNADYPLGGNYWDDYIGVDGNGDEFGDTPYPLAGNFNRDNHPLMKPLTISPVADFRYSPSNPTTQNVIQFTDKSTDIDGYIVSWLWDFGDGTNSIDSNPIHRYVDKGRYNVTLTIYDESGGKNITIQSIEVLNIKPVVSFEYSPPSPTDLQTVTFNDKSSDVDGFIISWFWNFGDGITSTAQNPVHQYSDNGLYIVTLSAVDNDREANEVSKQISVLNVGPTASFSFFSLFLPKVNDTISFTDTSTDTDGIVSSWSWDFGDGTTSNVRNPAKNYSAGGSFKVILWVTDNDGVSDIATEYITIFVSTTPSEDFQGSPLFNYLIFAFLGIAMVLIILVIRKYA
jgi:parallel beta-helix repeat protein